MALLCGAIFTAAGALMLGLMSSYLLQCQAAQSWREVEAEVLSASLVERTDRDGDPYQSLDCSYRYEFEGKQYTGKQVTLGFLGSGGSSPVQDAAYRDMKGAKDARRPIKVFVDPDDPSVSVYNRDVQQAHVHVLLWFGLVFGIIGAMTVRSARKRIVTVRLGNTPDGPTADVALAMAGPRIAPEVHFPSQPWWICTAIIVTVAAPLTYSAFAQAWSPEPANGQLYAIASVCALASVAMIAMTVRKLKLRMRLSRITLTMDPNPGCVGGDVGGRILLLEDMDQSKAVRVQLTCMRQDRSGDSYRSLWDAEQDATIISNGVEASWLFRSDPGLPSSIWNNQVRWVLEARIPTTSGQQSLHWVIPVLPGQRSSSIVAQPEEPIAAETGALWGKGIESRIPDGIQMTFPSEGRALTTLGGILFCVLIAALFWHVPDWFGNPLLGEDKVLVYAFRGMSALALLLALLGPVHQHSETILTIDKRELCLERRAFGFRIRNRILPRPDIVGIAPHADRCVVACTKDDDYLVLIAGLKGHAAARLAASELAERTQLPLLDKPPE